MKIVYTVFEGWYSSSKNKITQTIVAAFNNKDDAVDFIELKKYPGFPVEPANNYYWIGEAEVKEWCPKVPFLRYRNNLGHFTFSKVHSEPNDALVEKTLAEAKRLAVNKSYRINSEVEFCEVIIQ